MRVATLLATVTSVTAAAAIGAVATGPAVQSNWYQLLRKPAYQPPGQVFPVVWPALYADIAVVSAATIDRLSDPGEVGQRRAYQAALAVNLALNAGWSWLFFNQRRFASSTFLSAALTASSVDLARRAIDVRGARAVPLVLYPLWCAFATVLSGHISLLNRRASESHYTSQPPHRRHVRIPGQASDRGRRSALPALPPVLPGWRR